MSTEALRSVRSLAFFLLLVVTGCLGNIAHLPLFFGVDFLFGSIAVMLILQWFPPVCGVIAAAIVSSYTYALWGHPYAIIIFTAEAVFVAWRARRGKGNIALADGTYWLVLGLYLVGIFYGGVLKLPLETVISIALKQAGNGMVNALVASLIGQVFFPKRWLRGAGTSFRARPLSLQNVSFNLLVSFIVFPVLALTVFNGWQVLDAIEADIQSQLVAEKAAVELVLQDWVADRQKAIAKFAATASVADDSWESLQPLLQFLQDAHSFAAIQVVDRAGRATTVLTDARLGQPLEPTACRASEPANWVRMSETESYFAFAAPIADGNLACGAVPATDLTALLQKHGSTWQAEAFLLDERRQVIASSTETAIDPLTGGTVEAFGDDGGFFLWMPERTDLSRVARWRQSYYGRASSEVDGLPGKLLLRLSPVPHIDAMNALYIRHLALILALWGAALPIAACLSKNLVAPLRSLTRIASRLPQQLARGETLQPMAPSRIIEIEDLGSTIWEMSALLQAQFGKVRAANSKLEERVRERTAALSASEQRATNLIGATADALLVVDLEGRIRFCNPAAERLFGRPQQELEEFEFGPAIPTALRETIELRIVQPGGRPLFAQMRAATIDWDGEPAYLVCLTDVTQRHIAEAALQQREASYRSLLENLDAGVVVCAPDASIMLCNAAACQLLCLPVAELLGQRIDDLPLEWCREDSTPLAPDEHPVVRVIQQQEPLQQFVFGIRRRTGEYTWILANAFPEFGDKKLRQVVLTFTNISTLKQAETKLRHAALHDVLTGLPNRTLLLEHLDRALQRAKRHADYRFAVMFVDLDRFKTINDSLGHPVGDRLLLMVSRCLKEQVRANDTVCRLGGDEFVVLLDSIADAREALSIAERIQSSLQSLHQLDSREISTSASIGIALSQETYTHANELLRDADTAMYRAKSSGRARAEIFDASMHQKAVERFRLETSLHRALERNEFFLEYQPIVGLRDRKILGFEALVRWEHPERGRISPSHFIPLSEETGSIVPLGAWVLETACRQVRAWQKDFPDCGRTLRMSANVAARQIQDSDFLNTLDRILAQTGLAPEHLNLELTEGSLLEDTHQTARVLRSLQERGISTSIDDFGTGYSSLAYLKRLPVNTLKIDRSFVAGLGRLDEDERIVEAIVTLARTFGLDVVAEGVESKSQAEALAALGCQAIQGYWIAPPLGIEQVEAVLAGCCNPALSCSDRFCYLTRSTEPDLAYCRN